MKTPKMIDIVGDRTRMAKFSHCIAGVLYYNVEVDETKYMFPIDTNNKEDVGTATFEAEIKAITLMRYIGKAIKNDSFLQIS